MMTTLVGKNLGAGFKRGENECPRDVSGANLRLSDEDLEEAREVIRNAQVLVLQKEIPETTNVAVAKLAKGYRSGISGCAGGLRATVYFPAPQVRVLLAGSPV